MTDDEKKDQKDLKDLKDQNDKDIIQIKKSIEYLKNDIYNLKNDIYNFKENYEKHKQLLNKNEEKIKDIEISYKNKLFQYEQKMEMYNFNLQQMIKEFNEINSLIIHPDNKNPFIQESLHDKLGNKALEISKFTSEKKEFTQTKSKVIDDYILEIKKIKDNCDLCIEYMSKIFEEIEIKRKKLDIKEKELQNLDQNPDQNPDQKRLRTS